MLRMSRLPFHHPDDVKLQQPLGEAIELLREWKHDLPPPRRPGDKNIHEELRLHAESCGKCNGTMVSLSTFQKMMAGDYEVTERPLRDAFLHALEDVYGLVPRTQGFRTRSGEIVPDPLFCEEQANEFYTLFRTYMVSAKVLIGWARFLPCSLETDEFMEEHHRSIFGFYGGEARKECTELYNRIGRIQREAFEQRGFQRPWTFWHLMLKKDVCAIAQGLGEFERVRPEVRKRCLENLLTKIIEPRWKLKLVVAESMPHGVPEHVIKLDCAVCLDDRLVFRRDGWRVITYSTVAKRIQQFRGVLDTFVQQAEYRQNGQTARLLEELIAAM